MLLNALQEIYASNEVKLVRLVAIKIITQSRILFQKYVLENKSFQASMISLKTKIEKMQEAAEREKLVKSGEQKVKEIIKKVEGAVKPHESEK